MGFGPAPVSPAGQHCASLANDLVPTIGEFTPWSRSCRVLEESDALICQAAIFYMSSCVFLM